MKNKLSNIPFFADIPDKILNELSDTAFKKVVPASTIIFRQGDPGDGFYVINSGTVRIYRKNEEGMETTLIRLGP